MERDNIFTSKFMDNICNTIVFIGVTMFALDFPYYIWETFNFNNSNLGLARLVCLALCTYIAIMRYGNYLTVKGLEMKLIYHYRDANKEEKNTVKKILSLICFDDEEN